MSKKMMLISVLVLIAGIGVAYALTGSTGVQAKALHDCCGQHAAQMAEQAASVCCCTDCDCEGCPCKTECTAEKCACGDCACDCCKAKKGCEAKPADGCKGSKGGCKAS